ncbi:E3 ubiquitin-protein ligase RBBP6-like [Oncorhynchus kisutch]|uniref:E3 ubiquitin-protein ligase RBBP6-like n=1 Tax=Oncorhynchus kisutch TaxID=8019 RepID=UPI0012DC565E|nr:E3 ubiquitin-protein ligase RBBP6-like [Oncorhynchus kisutch]
MLHLYHWPQLSKTANLAEANASEDDKIRAMMSQSNHDYDPIHYVKKLTGPPPANYTCYRCGKNGHHIRNCPTGVRHHIRNCPTNG